MRHMGYYLRDQENVIGYWQHISIVGHSAVERNPIFAMCWSVQTAALKELGMGNVGQLFGQDRYIDGQTVTPELVHLLQICPAAYFRCMFLRDEVKARNTI